MAEISITHRTVTFIDIDEELDADQLEAVRDNIVSQWTVVAEREIPNGYRFIIEECPAIEFVKGFATAAVVAGKQ